MSKTLTGILEVAVGIGLEFVPGGQAIGTSLILTGVTTAASGLLAGHTSPDTTVTAMKSPYPSRVSAYGRARQSGAYYL